MAESLTPSSPPRAWRQYPFAGITAIWLIFLAFAVIGYVMLGPLPFDSFQWKAHPQQRQRMLHDLLHSNGDKSKLLGRSTSEVLEILGQPDRFLSDPQGGATFVYRVPGTAQSSTELNLYMNFQHNKLVSLSSDRSD